MSPLRIHFKYRIIQGRIIMKKLIKRLAIVGLIGLSSVPCLASSHILINYNGQELKLTNKPISEDERVLLPLRELSEKFDYKVVWDDKNRTIQISNEEAHITLKINEKIARVNGKSMTLDVPAQMIEGVTYVPIRFISEAFDKKVNWDSGKNAVNIEEIRSYTVDPKTNQLIYHQNGGKKIVGEIKVTSPGQVYISAHKTINEHEVVIVDNNYGEPSIFFDRTIFYLDGEKVLGKAKASYKNRVADDIVYLDDKVALTDGKKAYIYDDAAGKLLKEYDLQKLVGTGNYEIEAVGDNFLLVREDQKGLLTFVNLDNKQVAEIYQEISLSEAEKEYALHGHEPTYDGIVFEKKEGNALYFRYSGLDIKGGKFVYYIKK